MFPVWPHGLHLRRGYAIGRLPRFNILIQKGRGHNKKMVPKLGIEPCLSGSVPKALFTELPLDIMSSYPCRASGRILEELSAVIAPRLRSQYVLSLPQLRNIHNLELAQRPAGDVLGSGVTDHLLESAVLSLGAVKASSMVSIAANIPQS